MHAMQSFGARHAPHYTVQALCARGKRAVVLPHAFGLRSIVAGWTWCATSMASAAAARTASAAAARTATTTMHSPTHRRLRQPLRRKDVEHDRASHGQRGRDVRYARTTKETQAKPASLIPPEPTTRNLLAGFSAQPRPSGR